MTKFKTVFRVNLRCAITALLMAVSIAPAAYAMPLGPDPGGGQTAREPGASPTQDLRSPDTRDAVRQALAHQARDLRSPDARDAARGTEISPVNRPSVPPLPSVETPSSGFQWDDAGIGAAVMLALLSVGTGTVLLVGRHRRRRGHPLATS
jgi:hypothetical protein